MAVSEGYVVDYLLQETASVPPGLEWWESETGGYTADCNRVRLRLSTVQNMSGPRLCLEFGFAHDTVYIQEPCKVAIFGRQYRNDAEETVAGLLHRLHSAVAQQVQLRHEGTASRESEIRESIFRRLLFGSPAGSGLGSET